MGHEEADYDVVKNYWEARLETLKQEIADETKEINDSALGREVKMLSWIKEAVDFATKDDDDDDENGNNGGTPAGGGQAPQMESEAEKKAKEEAAIEAARQAAEQQARSRQQVNQNSSRERVSMKKRLNESIETVRRREEKKQSEHLADRSKKKGDQNLS